LEAEEAGVRVLPVGRGDRVAEHLAVGVGDLDLRVLGHRIEARGRRRRVARLDAHSAHVALAHADLQALQVEGERLGAAARDGRATAGAVAAAVAARARVAVVAGRAVERGRVGADAGLRVAGAGGVALVERRADDRRAGRAGAGLAALAARAGVAVVAGG